LEASKKAIPDSIEKLRIHERLMRNFLDLHERATFTPKGSSKDKHFRVKAWINNMSQGSCVTDGRKADVGRTRMDLTSKGSARARQSGRGLGRL
jgi:hypothetical protein